MANVLELIRNPEWLEDPAKATQNMFVIRQHVEHDLHADLQLFRTHFERAESDIADIKVIVSHLESAKTKPSCEIEVPIGAGVSMHAYVADSSVVYVNIGSGVYIPMQRPEALAFFKVKLKRLNGVSEKCSERIQFVQSTISNMLDLLQALRTTADH